MSGGEEENFQCRVLSRQSGAKVEEIAPGIVRKTGDRVTRNEEAALRLVKEHTDVPVPDLISSNYFTKGGRECGTLLMELAEGAPLDSLWDGFDNNTKKRICHDIWRVVAQLRRIPRPPALDDLYLCGANGSLTVDVLIRDTNETGTPILTDEDLRACIYERYLRFNGGSYPEYLPDILPRSSISVFTHGDLTPRNILINGTGQISAILDWEGAGWYPDYWEFANMMKPSNDLDWMKWMDRMKPIEWDIMGIAKARRVLF